MKLYTLQLLRFFAALFVLLFHLELMDSGYKGVDIFFVMSGFVMYYTTFQLKRKSITTFYINRLTKIFLLYWIVIFIFYFVKPFEVDGSFLKTFFLIPDHFPILSISWTLSYELYFYLIFGIVAYLIKTRPLQKIIYCLVFTISFFVTILNVTGQLPKGTLINFLLGQNIWEFLLGILSAALSLKIAKMVSLPYILSTLIVATLAFIIIEIPYENGVYHLVYGPLAFIIIIAATAFEHNRLLNKYIAKISGVLGDASYGIYLSHPIIVVLIKGRDIFSDMLIIITTIITAILVNQLIENKLLTIVRQKMTLLISKF